MRALKFRGKGKNGVWYYGDLILQGDRALIHKSTEDWKMFGIEEESEIINPNTVGQFTGLVDKNKKEIYEGDILFRDNGHEKVNEERVVKFERGSFMLDHIGIKLCGIPVRFVLSAYNNDYEIIGNIYTKLNIG